MLSRYVSIPLLFDCRESVVKIAVMKRKSGVCRLPRGTTRLDFTLLKVMSVCDPLFWGSLLLCAIAGRGVLLQPFNGAVTRLASSYSDNRVSYVYLLQTASASLPWHPKIIQFLARSINYVDNDLQSEKYLSHSDFQPNIYLQRFIKIFFITYNALKTSSWDGDLLF